MNPYPDWSPVKVPGINGETVVSYYYNTVTGASATIRSGVATIRSANGTTAAGGISLPDTIEYFNIQG